VALGTATAAEHDNGGVSRATIASNKRTHGSDIIRAVVLCPFHDHTMTQAHRFLGMMIT
jgi:hypothetical protein